MKIRNELLGGTTIKKLKKEWTNCDIFTIGNAIEKLWVAKNAENSNKARLFGFLCYFSTKPGKT